KPDYVQFTQDEIRVFVQEAAHAQKFVISHSMGTEGIKNSILCGVRTVDHAWYPDDECITLAKERGTIFIPTLSWDMQIIEKGKGWLEGKDQKHQESEEGRSHDGLWHGFLWIADDQDGDQRYGT